MKLHLALGALALAATLQAAEHKDVNRTASLASDGSVTIETLKGSIHVSAWDRPQIEINARIEAESDGSSDHKRFEATDIWIDTSPASVRIRTRYPDWNGGIFCCWDGGSNPEVHYTIQMPRTARLSIRDHRSETEIGDLSGGLNIETHRGSVRARKISGPVEIHTHRGEIALDFRSFTARTLIDSYRGPVEISMPRNSAFELNTDLDRRRASFESDFPIITRSVGRRTMSIEGPVNGGGPVLKLVTYRSQIRLRAE